MHTVLIVIHLMIVLALVGVVLIQRSEGGGLGIGGGSGFMSARGAANALTRTTAILATAFFITSLALGLLARYGSSPTDILDRIPVETQGQGNGILDQLGGSSETEPATPAPAADANGVPTDSDTTTTAPAATTTAPATETPANEATTGDAPAADTPATEAPAADDANSDVPGAVAPADDGGVPTGQ
ncbi:MAG: preprotein translocase subunit SecG [Rhizobiales bacterium]|nr:preprotein translocase subunit SecG [Hoeflea sp.]MBG20531.1 preprotein translocase subunit SecG [Hyphomicrobiales bacterium]|tara:strand:+ start:7519 stop:8079 length:561 start_codon:yes stop_codon:yes gene_type:complete